MTRNVFDDFDGKLAGRLTADARGETRTWHRARVAVARAKAKAVASADVEYKSALLAAHRAAARETFGIGG
jgi:hypothetical protein